MSLGCYWCQTYIMNKTAIVHRKLRYRRFGLLFKKSYFHTTPEIESW